MLLKNVDLLTQPNLHKCIGIPAACSNPQLSIYQYLNDDQPLINFD